MENPFTCRVRIQDPDMFWGRKAEIRDVMTRLRKMLSSSIVGERRIGKSSLLYYLYTRGNELLNDGSYRFVYLTMEDAANRRLSKFLNQILKVTGLPEISKEAELLDALEDFADKIKDLKEMKLVVLLDEFDKFSDLRKEFPPEFFDQMRSLLQGGNLAMVPASKKRLQSFGYANKISPFYNIFNRINLEEFTEDEKTGFIENNWNGFTFNEQEIEFLKSIDERHPIKLQTISYWLFENRHNEYSKKELKEKIENEVKSYFLSKKDKIFKFKKHIPDKSDIKDYFEYYLKLKK